MSWRDELGRLRALEPNPGNVLELPKPVCRLCAGEIEGKPAWIDGHAWHPWEDWPACNRRALRKLADGDDGTRRVKP